MSANKKKILIVDDDLLAAAAVQRPLVKAGYDVVTAANGAAALDYMSTDTPNLVILDVVMPGLSGFDVCRRIRENPATRCVPVIFLTATNRVRDMTEGQRAGSDLYLVKPVLTARLMNMVGMFLAAGAGLARKSGLSLPSS